MLFGIACPKIKHKCNSEASYLAFGVKHTSIVKIIATSAILFGASIAVSPSAHAFSGSGAGTPSDPYEIYTCAQLQEIANDLSADYELLDDIDCTGVGYTAIGDAITPFTGTLNGNLQTISNITLSGGDRLGVFGETNGATVENIKLENNSISGGVILGTLVGQATDGTIRNIRAESTNTVSGTGNIGGIIGSANSSTVAISRTFFKGTVTLTGAYGGGILGYAAGSITIADSYSSGTLNAGVSYAGGIVGSVNSGSPVISRVYSSMDINGSGVLYGGIWGGFFGGTLQNSFSAADLTSNIPDSGGLFGLGNGTSTNNYFDEFAAGLSNCSSSGAASCTPVNAGNATPNYFVNNSTNDPLDTWNFDYLWDNSTGLPSFPMFGAAQANTPTATATSLNYGYQFVALINAGNVSSIQLRYRPTNAGGTWTYVSGLTSNNMDYTLSGLNPNTAYTIEMRAYYDGVDEFSDWDDGRITGTTLATAAVASSDATLAETGDNYELVATLALLLITLPSLLLITTRAIKIRN